MPREILVEWTTPSGSDHRSVFMFDTVPTVASQRTALAAFLAGCDAALDNAVSWRIATTGREMDDVTGTLTGSWTETSVKTGAGDQTAEPVPDASQVLIRWLTPDIVNGRFLRGRTFIPGLSTGLVVGGNLSSGSVTGFNTAGTTFIATVAGIGVWHRPVQNAGGQFELATACSTWNELAVLRRRRG